MKNKITTHKEEKVDIEKMLTNMLLQLPDGANPDDYVIIMGKTAYKELKMVTKVAPRKYKGFFIKHLK